MAMALLIWRSFGAIQILLIVKARLQLQTTEDEPDDGYFFEWIIRESLVPETDFVVQGTVNKDDGFNMLSLGSDYTVVSSEVIESSNDLHRVRIKVTTDSPRYYLRLSAPEE